MSVYLAILADIKAKLEGVTDVGNVYDYYRWNNDLGAFIELFSYTPAGAGKQIRGWEISRISATEHKDGAFFRHHTFSIDGYMSMSDANASDKTFQVLIDSICDVFRSPTDGATWYYLDGDNPKASPAQVLTIDVRAFGNVLCHHAKINLSITERIVI